MRYQTVHLSSFEAYVAEGGETQEELADQTSARQERLARFPHPVMLEVAFPEMDYANRWCWRQFGPGDGECCQRHSEYCACPVTPPHSHIGAWTCHFFVKTDYDFGFNEWYFASQEDQKRFLANVDQINWGEKFPKYQAWV